jgi:hypothetical protein
VDKPGEGKGDNACASSVVELAALTATNKKRCLVLIPQALLSSRAPAVGFFVKEACPICEQLKLDQLGTRNTLIGGRFKGTPAAGRQHSSRAAAERQQERTAGCHAAGTNTQTCSHTCQTASHPQRDCSSVELLRNIETRV